MNILLAIDGSPHSDRACETVAAMDRPTAPAGVARDTVYMVHVTTPLPEPPMPFPDVFVEDDMLVREQIETEHEVAAGRRLTACRDMLPSTMQVVTEHRIGAPAKEILAAVADHGIDMVVMGAKGVDDAADGGIGGVTQKVSRYAPCHVLVARQPGTRMRHVLVALDDGPAARTVLDLVATVPWLAHSTLTLTHVVEDRYLHESRIAASQFAGSEAYLRRLQRTLLREGQDFLSQQAEILKGKGLKADTLVLEGDPATVIQDRAGTGGFDLVVMGARGRHGLAHFIMGSTSQKVLRHAGSSVLLVRTDQPRQGRSDMG